MKYSTRVRKKDKGYQYIITYKVTENDKWRTQSKQGFKKSQEAKDAMDKALDELKKLNEGRVDISAQSIIFKQFTDMFLEHLKLHREINTILSFKTALNNFEYLNNKELCKITNLDIQKGIDILVKKGLRVLTIRDYLTRLGTIFAAAMNDYNFIIKLPTKGVKIGKEKEESTKKALNKVEVDKLLSDFKDSKYYLVLLIASKCGLRLGEILGLTWKDVDYKNGVLIVNKQWKQIAQDKYDFGKLKSKNSYREVPMSEKVINELKNRQNVVNIDNRIFNFKNTDSTSICINTLLKRKGYDICIHELRHTFATMIIANGMDFKTAAKILGHEVEQTMRTYSHVNDDMMLRAKNIIQNIF